MEKRQDLLKQLDKAFKLGDKPRIRQMLRTNQFTPKEVRKYIHGTMWRLHSIEILRLILKTGVKPDEHDVIAAVAVGNLTMLNMLLESGAKPYGSCIRKAAMENKPDLLERLLVAGGDPCTKNNSPLNQAALNGCYKSIEVLREFGVDPQSVRADILEKVKKRSVKSEKYAETLKVINGASTN